MGMRGEKPKLTKVFLYCPFFVIYLVTLTNVGSRSQRTRAFHLPPRAAAACPSAPWTPARALHWAGPPTLAPCCVVGNLSLHGLASGTEHALDSGVPASGRVAWVASLKMLKCKKQ
jgi:hypothetical protein